MRLHIECGVLEGRCYNVIMLSLSGEEQDTPRAPSVPRTWTSRTLQCMYHSIPPGSSFVTCQATNWDWRRAKSTSGWDWAGLEVRTENRVAFTRLCWVGPNCPSHSQIESLAIFEGEQGGRNACYSRTNSVHFNFINIFYPQFLSHNIDPSISHRPLLSCWSGRHQVWDWRREIMRWNLVMFSVFMLQYFLLCLASPPPPRAGVRLPPTPATRPGSLRGNGHNSVSWPGLRIITQGMSIEASNWSWLVLIWQRPQFFTD